VLLFNPKFLLPYATYAAYKTGSTSSSQVFLSAVFCFSLSYSSCVCSFHTEARLSLSSLLLHYFRDDAGAHGAPSLAYGEPQFLFHRDGG